MMQLFSKLLTFTDTRKRLAIPTKSLTSLLHNSEGNAVELHVRHGTAVWPIMCTTRRKGPKKPVLSKGWRSFVLKNKLNVGDIVTLFKDEDEAGYLNYRIEVERADRPSPKYEDGKVKRFGVTDEKVEKCSFRLFGVPVVETVPLVKRSDESTAGKADIGAKEEREYHECSKRLNLDLTLAPPKVNGRSQLLRPCSKPDQKPDQKLSSPLVP